jgi:cytoskeletal protein CcmA (bactofilin family)
MKTIDHKIEGDARIEQDSELHGMIAGNVTVAPDVIFELCGMVVGNLELERLSRTFLRGTVTGDVVNRGGHLEVWGRVTGRIVRQDGTTIVHPKAVVSRAS